MLNLDQLQTLSAILRLGSFEAAARDLGLSQPAVSQRLRALETRVGQPLVLRGTPCTGTELGHRLARHADEVGLMQGQLLGPLVKPAPGTAPVARHVHVALNADSLASWVLPALCAAQEAEPGLMFDLVLDDQDHSADWLRRGDVSAAITGTAQPPGGCDSLPLGALDYVATASPAFLARHCPDGITAPAMRAAPMLTFNRKDRLQRDWLDHNFGPGPVPPTHYMPSPQGFVAAAIGGLGWGMNPEPLVRDALADGRLVALRPDCPMATPLFWQVSHRMVPALAGLTRAIRRAAHQHLTQPTPDR